MQEHDRYFLGILIGIIIGALSFLYAQHLQKQHHQLEEILPNEKSWKITYATDSGPVTCEVRGWGREKDVYIVTQCEYAQRDSLNIIRFQSIKEL